MEKDVRSTRDQILFNQMADGYVNKDKIKSSSCARKHRLVSTIKSISNHNILRILEIGCGAGYSALYLKDSYSEFVGIDHSLNLVLHARNNFNYGNVSFKNISIEDYFPEEKFDVIIAIGVLHHLNDPLLVLRKLKKMLTTGGVIAVNEPTTGNIVVGVLRRIRKIIDKNYSNDQVEFSSNQLSEIFTQADLKNIKCVPQGYFSTPFAEIILRPVKIFYALAILAVQADKIIESYFGRALNKLSWNTIVTGYRE